MRSNRRLRQAGGLPGLSGTLLASRDGFARRLVFAWAYQAAFAPEAAGVLLPGMARDLVSPEALARAEHRLEGDLQQGFGGWEGKVERYRSNLVSLAGLALDCGTGDELRWIPEGCRHLASLLRANEVKHELRLHDGGHVDRLAERLGEAAFPFLGERLTSVRSR
jgi:hypothetical protein